MAANEETLGEKFRAMLGDVVQGIGAELKEQGARFAAEVGDTLHVKNLQAASEIAGALWTGSAYVPYGEGQKMPELDAPQQEQGQQIEAPHQEQQQRQGWGR